MIEIKRMVVVLAVAGGSMAAPGCGPPAGYFPVSGKVLYRGEPASGAVVYFHRAGDPAPAGQPIPFAVVQDDGRFSLASDGVGSGARPGSYSVLVEWRDGAGDGVVPVKGRGRVKLVKRSRVHSGPDRLKGRYFDISEPLLHADVKAASNQLPPFELTD
jgi:hypothetical protein